MKLQSTGSDMKNFKGLTIMAFVTPMREKMQGLIETGGGQAMMVPLDEAKALREGIVAIIEGRVSVLIFVGVAQIANLLSSAAKEGLELPLRRALAKVAICSAGPATSASLRERQVFADIEAMPHDMDDLVGRSASLCHDVLTRKCARATESWIRTAGPMPPVGDSPMLRACRRQKSDRVPIWLMRQAGRYMSEYQAVRGKVSFLELCKDPDLAAEVTISAVERLNVDAAIIFADILLVVEPMGLALDFQESIGPCIANPVRVKQDIEKLKNVQVEDSLGYVLEAIKKVRTSMHQRIPLIGFSGAPFTIASYMIEGKGSRNYIFTKTLMRSEPKLWHSLMEKITTVLIDYLKAQVKAGCQILQVFDSWVGTLSPADYREYVLPHCKRLFASLPREIPSIHFGTGTSTLLPLQKEAGGDVIGLDWRVDIARTWEELGDVAIQGNLDPVLLFSKPEVFLGEARRILEAVGSRPGFIFNLGHGILPETPVDHVMELVDFVHAWGQD